MSAPLERGYSMHLTAELGGRSKVKDTIAVSGVGCPGACGARWNARYGPAGNAEVLAYSQLEDVVSFFVRSRMRGT
jgi:hypothetical protein